MRRSLSPVRSIRSQRRRKPGDDRCPVFQFAFVDDEDAPPHRRIGGEGLLVARPIAADFGAPIGGVGLRQARAARTVMAMPEAAVHEDRELAVG